MLSNKQVVEKYIDGFNKSDHAQILSCLTEDIDWTIFGYLKLHGKEAYDKEIENPAFTGSPRLEIIRLVEEDDVIMAELIGEAQKADGTTFRMAMAEVFVMKDGLIDERKAYVFELKENEYK